MYHSCLVSYVSLASLPYLNAVSMKAHYRYVFVEKVKKEGVVIRRTHRLGVEVWSITFYNHRSLEQVLPGSRLASTNPDSKYSMEPPESREAIDHLTSRPRIRSSEPACHDKTIVDLMGNIETPLGYRTEANDTQLAISLWNKDAVGHMEVTDDTNERLWV